MLTPEDMSTLGLTCKLAVISTLIMLVIGVPLAWWLTRTQSFFRPVINAIVALPLVLPPSVLGFYLLLWMGPKGLVGELTQKLGLGILPFTFSGLVIASVLYSIPFVVQPLQSAFAGINPVLLDAASTLGASPLRRFFTIILPLSRQGLLSAVVLGFAHTVGEFGVVLMVGGNIPDQTRVVSVQIYNHVEALDYASAHGLAGVLVVLSLGLLLLLNLSNRGSGKGRMGW
jgi:molybdate transport system permease protein